MVNLTFGEQVKIILSRKGMTIKQLAEQIEMSTGKSMSRQNLTQRLGRDNFQEKDMRLIAEILGCKFQLNIMEMDPEAKPVPKAIQTLVQNEEITVGDLLDMSSEEIEGPEEIEEPEKIKEPEKTETVEESEERKMLRKGIKGYYKKTTSAIDKEKKQIAKESILGEINPYTGKEYKTNSVRMHPKKIGYVQVYNQEQHKWNEMTEWAFLGYEERKKRLLGANYVPPIYLD